MRALGVRQSPMVLAILLLANAAVARWTYTKAALDIDYFTLWSVPHAVARLPPAAQVPDIYTSAVQRDMGALLLEEARGLPRDSPQVRATQITASLYDGRVDATGTPFVYAIVGLLSSPDFAGDAAVFQFVSAVCFLIALGLLLRTLRFPLWSAVLALVFFGLEFTPIRADVRVGNINQLQLLTLALFIVLSTKGRPLVAGLALGFGAALKPNLLPVAIAALLFALAARDYRRLTRTMTGLLTAIAIAVAIGATYFGSLVAWGDFVRSVPATLGQGYPLENGNYGLAELLSTVTTLPVAQTIVALAVGVVIMVTVIRRRRGSDANGSAAFHDSFLAAGVGIALMLLASRLAWLHYYALTIPAALYLLRPTDAASAQPGRGRMVEWWLGVLALACLSNAAQQLSTVFTESLMANVAALALFTGCVHSLWGMRSRSGDVVRTRTTGKRRKLSMQPQQAN